jgi:thiamine biosynthesis lipoprotein
MSVFVTSFRALGSQINIWLDTDGDGETVLRQVPGWLEDIEAALSRFRPGSELSRLNRHPREWADVSETVLDSLGAALRAARITGGLVTPLVLHALVAAGYDRSFETMPQAEESGSSAKPVPASDWEAIQLDYAASRVWLPDAIDLGGTAKGWAAKQVVQRLSEHGSILVDLGGDIIAQGKRWMVHVFDPFQPETPFAAVMLHDCAIATSGTDYRRWGTNRHHIIDPHTGIPAQTDVISATVIHPDAVLAEALAKAVVLQGSIAGLKWLAQHDRAAGLVFDRTGRVLATENSQAYITHT